MLKGQRWPSLPDACRSLKGHESGVGQVAAQVCRLRRKTTQATARGAVWNLRPMRYETRLASLRTM